jgi:two-component system, sensor histidine kinase
MYSRRQASWAAHNGFLLKTMDSQLDSFAPAQYPLPPKVDRARAQLLFARGNFSNVSGMGLALLIAYASLQVLSTAAVLAWLFPKLLIALVRMVVSWRMQGKQDHSPSDIQTFALLGAVDGLVWGSCALWLLYELPVDRVGVLIACLVGVAAVGVFVLYASMRASLGFAVPVLLPAMAIALWPGTTLPWYVAPGLTLYLLVLVTEARRMRAQLIGSLRLRLSFEALSRDRAAAQDAALSLSHVRDQFVTTLNEQMRSPVAGIVGIARALMRRPEFISDMDLSRLRLMEHAGEHVLKLIDDVVDYSRFSSGDMPLEQQPFDLAGVIDEITQLIAVDAMERNIAFEIVPGGLLQSGAPYTVAGDAVRVRQVLEHLVSQVLRSISAGEVRLSMVHDAGTGLLNMTVSSHGVATPGVVAQTHKVLGAAEGKDAASRVLGLGLSRRYAQAMNGDVAIRRDESTVLTLLLELELPLA